jgi:glycosyltransferase involved in cell wall biosynthesis
MPTNSDLKKLQISVICPVRNSMAGLPSHAEHLCSLAPLVEELIVVDSCSSDGTTDYLKKALAGYSVHFLEHPPGLYQSWNYAISQASQPYLTVATVGDSLPVDSLKQLVETLERFNADVVVSPPTVLGSGREILQKKYAIHDLVECNEITEATEIPGLVWLLYFLFYMPSSLLCSSASNLYRTSLLQQNPFPTDHGHAGDSAWSLQMSRKARWVIDPKVESFFWEHDPSPHKVNINISTVEKLRLSSRDFLNQSADELIAMGFSDKLLACAEESIETLCESAILMQAYRAARISIIPRFFQPKAANLLARKNIANSRRKLRLQQLREEIRLVKPLKANPLGY